MKRGWSWWVVGGLVVLMVMLPACGGKEQKKVGKPSPDQALELLKEGNRRFVRGQPQRPNLTPERIIKAGRESQNDHAYATIISCSDSRVPVEHIFDAGIMDLFIVRVAGNVCDTDEAGSIEYGLAHVKTPVLVVLGHTQCGAVTAVTESLLGHGHALERNIPPLVDNIEPAVKRAMKTYPHLKGKEIIPYAIEENVWVAVEDLFLRSPAVRRIVKEGKAKVVGAIYDVGTGEIAWLPEAKVINILAAVEGNPLRVVDDGAGSHAPEYAEGAHGQKAAAEEKH
ncbi:MAG: carbonic anhydrase [Deltaproteobacteria bacterium]|nr:carbonic anhydrase [Deltaproteobacteria bacterium]